MATSYADHHLKTVFSLAENIESLEMDEDFDNFLKKVTEVEDLVKQLRCPDPHVANQAQRRADLQLGGGGIWCSKDRTVINQKAIDSLGGTDDHANMSKEAFMMQVERDAENRARDKMERRKLSDELKTQANKAFREKKFEKALELYSKAINNTPDSCVLYENRALTYLQLQLYRRVVEDCDWSLRLNNSSLKALLYKGRALFLLGEKETADKCILEAKEKHPHHSTFIQDYEVMWKEDG